MDSCEQYRVTDLHVLPAADNLVLIRGEDAQQARYVRTEVADLLLSCSEFRTLDEHVLAYVGEQSSATFAPRALRNELQRLARSGYMIGKSTVLGKLGGSPAQPAPPRISSVGFPTRDRVDVLERSVRSFAENGRQHGRDSEFVVVDDSADAGTREAYRNALRNIKRQFGIRVTYAGLEEKLGFVEKIVEATGVSQDIARFLCLGDERYGVTTVGANRNSLLLHTVGDLILSADDDTVCKVAAPPSVDGGVAFSSEPNPLQSWFFPDRDAAFDSVQYVEHDFLSLHEQWLGMRAPAYPVVGEREHDLELDSAQPALLRRLIAQSWNAKVTQCGTVGDSAWDDPHFYLFQRGDTFDRLTRSDEVYAFARTAREVVQAPTRTTVTDQVSPMFAMCLGMDNRQLLPPFPPVGRAEDVVFGEMLSRCFDAAYSVYLPWVLQHSPVQERSFMLESQFAIGPNTLLLPCIGQLVTDVPMSPADRLAGLGRVVEAVGRLQDHAFEAFLELHVGRSMSVVVSMLEERMMDGRVSLPAFWVRDARAFITQARRNALAPAGRLFAFKGGREALQSYMVFFGQALAAWPTIVEASRNLRSEGIRLAQQV